MYEIEWAAILNNCILLVIAYILTLPIAYDRSQKTRSAGLRTFHFCVQDPDIEGLVTKIVEHGGKQRMLIREYYPGKKPYRMCYVEDPFGLIFEVYSHSYELTYSQGAY